MKYGNDTCFGNCEEQLTSTDCQSTVGQQITDRLPTGYQQITDKLPTGHRLGIISLSACEM